MGGVVLKVPLRPRSLADKLQELIGLNPTRAKHLEALIDMALEEEKRPKPKPVPRSDSWAV